jgi:hypothetical protein
MRSTSQAESRNLERQDEGSVRSVLFVVTVRLTLNQTLEKRQVRLAAPMAAGGGLRQDFAHFKYLSSGGWSNSLIWG